LFYTQFTHTVRYYSLLFLDTEARHCDYWLGLVRKPSSDQHQQSYGRKWKKTSKDAWVWIGEDNAYISSSDWNQNQGGGSDRIISYTNWNDKEPNNADGNERCAQMLWIFDWKWNDASCDKVTSCYVCQSTSDY